MRSDHRSTAFASAIRTRRGDRRRTSRKDHASHRRSSSGRGCPESCWSMSRSPRAGGLRDRCAREVVADGAVLEDLDRAGVGLLPRPGASRGEPGQFARGGFGFGFEKVVKGVGGGVDTAHGPHSNRFLPSASPSGRRQKSVRMRVERGGSGVTARKVVHCAHDERVWVEA